MHYFGSKVGFEGFMAIYGHPFWKKLPYSPQPEGCGDRKKRPLLKSIFFTLKVKKLSPLGVKSN